MIITAVDASKIPVKLTEVVPAKVVHRAVVVFRVIVVSKMVRQ